MTNQIPPNQSSLCPECGQKGSKVGRITIESLLKPDSANLITDEQFRFCDSLDCETVYFGDNGTTFAKHDLTVRVGVKENSAPRHVCYCFDHTIEEINAEVQETGQSTVLEDIKRRMKAACWCETKSPKGTCCLGTVGKYVKIAMAEHGDGESEAHENDAEEYKDCCANKAHSCSLGESCNGAEASQKHTGIIALGGSMLGALAASACCWLPLGLIVFGVSAGGVSAWFEHYRWLFLGITVVLLSAGFYLVYREPHCKPGSVCSTPILKMQRLNRSMLWIATVFVIISALFPSYVGYLLPKDNGIEISGREDQIIVATFDIAGMTCEACTIHLRNELVKVPGVLDVAVSYENSSAEISFYASRPPETIDLSSTVESSGYEAGIINLNSESP